MLEISHRNDGTAFEAVNANTGSMVILKRIGSLARYARMPPEVKDVTKCDSEFVLKCYNVEHIGNEVWVVVHGMADSLGCDGVFSMLFLRQVSAAWESLDGGRNTRDHELLSPGAE